VPTYEYACTDSACGHRFETVQSVSDDPLTLCPQCEGRLRKVFSAVGVVFKGPGFYRTDSRAASNGKSEANGKPDSSGKPDSKGTSESTKDKDQASPATKASSSSTSASGSSAGSSGAASGSTSSTKAAAG
jgi:putative FmdB family regulatory protein